MGKIDTVVKSEIVRLAQKEIRTSCGPVASDVRQLKRTVSRLRRAVAALERVGRAWSERVQAERAQLVASDEEVKASRLSGRLIRKLRTRLGLSQQQFGKLVGVSTVSVGFWEQSKTRPSGSNKTALIALRKLGKREVKELLRAKGAVKEKKPRKKKK